MDKSHRSLIYHMQTSKTSSIFCCKQDYNEGYCKDGSEHGFGRSSIEMVCSPPSFGNGGKFAPVLSPGNRNYQMFAYCPTINQQRCGFPNGTLSKEMQLLAGLDKSIVKASELKYL